MLQLELDLSKGDRKAMKGKPARVWIYQGLAPVKFDAEGRIVEARAWTAQCGPPPPKQQDGSKTRYSTDKPLPGLSMREENCIAKAQGPVRNAIKASEAYETDIRPMRWLRDP